MTSIQEKQLLDFLHGLYAPRGSHQLIEFILQRLPAIIDGHNRCLTRYDPASRAILQMNLHTPLHSRAFLETLREGGEEVAKSLWKLLPETPNSLHIISRQLSRTEWNNHPIYREMFHHEGVIDCMTMELGDASRRFMLCIHRDRRGFSPEEVTSFSLLSPHLVQAFSNARVFESSIPGLSGASPSENSRVHHLGPIGDTASRDFIRQNLARWHALLGHNPGNATDDLRDWIEAGINHLNRGILESAIPPFNLPGGGLTLRFRLMRNWGGESHLITEETNRHWQLTPREREVLHWVRAGKSDRDIGTILHLSHHTVKEHLRRIYRKTGTRRRTAAARLVPHQS
jgi:DNA-binding CsgD family transcriptional regulator